MIFNPQQRLFTLHYSTDFCNTIFFSL